MKFLLLKSMAILVVSSGAHAQEAGTSTSLLRGSKPEVTFSDIATNHEVNFEIEFASERASIRCNEPTRRFARGETHKQACDALAPRNVRYTCENGGRLCCTQSSLNPVRLGKYGLCSKVDPQNSNDVPTNVNEREAGENQIALEA
mmetsp:Transcript_22440/g.48307  ORF Transcript_22440/g.48307 Transcript_22440/m.48307 type:complete len:146 (+) Transcript_22440:98-535(+)|eukprot:CAMPEP_0172549118 /NCGR_PEP_ID=MMETSP1067-20121228/18282_1 /TAXON_ID=265564 ORGANISM="Thalassiosira punctigera, Strain Tpunct2005C2" /NCGR_SAMPLE_ID=MMETSP1067 /ASSEMBLY_ACC=CAM_ASM_000444 /LENGTH=145 /DNA_ID=CAMNT_0013336449 /DNA_START=81 /DNA_END=518 /DNA_ORIENTATION=-